MITFVLDITGIPEVERLQAALTPSELRAEIRIGMQRGMYVVHQNVPPYPPPPPDSDYVRTGTLGRATTTAVEDRGAAILGIIGNNTEYAPYVIGGPDEQAWMHTDRWWQLQGVVEQGLDAIVEEIAKRLEDKWNSL